MITARERQLLEQAHGQLRDRPGWAEEMVATSEVLQLVGRLYEEMEAAGLSQADLARAMGVHRRQILRWFRGDGAISAETLVAMGRHVGVRLEAKWVAMAAPGYASAPCEVEGRHGIGADSAWGMAA